jgi:hypothetical protein
VVSSGPNTVDPGGRAAWYRLSPEPDEPSEGYLGGRRSRRFNPPLEELLSFIEEQGRLSAADANWEAASLQRLRPLFTRVRGRGILRSSGAIVAAF